MTTTSNAMVEERNQKGDSGCGSKNVDSFVKINSISIDLADDSNKNHSSAKCDHFSIRGYVSEVRKKDWKLCWPFPLDDEKNEDEEDQTSLLPPLTSPKFRWWSCQRCQQETGTEGDEKGLVLRSGGSGIVSKSKSDYPHIPTISTGATHQPDVHRASKTNSVEKKQSDVNASTRVSTKHQDKKAVAYREPSTSFLGPSSGTSIKLSRPLDINLNVTEDKPEYDTVTESRQLDEARPVVPRTHNRGKQKVTDAYLPTPTGVCKPSPKIRSADQNATSADSQVNKLLHVDSGGSSILASSNVGPSEWAKRSSNGHVSGLLLDECDNPSSNSTEIVRSNNVRDHNQSSSAGPSRRKTRKVRLLTDLLFDSGSAKADPVTSKDASPLSTSVHSASTGTVNISVPQSQVSLPDDRNRREDLGESKKRKLLRDEERRSPEMRSAINLNTKAKSFKESEGTSDARTDSDTKGGSSTRLYGQSGNRTHWSKFRSDNNVVTDIKKKKMKIQTSDARPHLVPIEDQVGISNKVNVEEAGISFRAVKEVSSSRVVEKIPKGVPINEKKQSSFSKGKGKMPQVNEMPPSKYPMNRSGLLKKVPITRNEDSLRTVSTGPTTLSFHQVEDLPIDMGLQLSLGGSSIPKKCSSKYTPGVGDIGVSKFYWRESTPMDETVMNNVERNYISESTVPSKSSSYGFFKKRVHGDVGGSQLITYGPPVLNGKQSSNLHSEERRRSLGKQVVEISGSHNSQKTIKAKEHSALPRKRVLEIADRVPDKVTVDDIPMDIVELMARNQYERGQQNPENNRRLSKPSLNEGSINPMIDYDRRPFTTGKLRISEETRNNNRQANPQPRSGRNGITMSRKNPKPTRQKPVNYYPNLVVDHSNRTQMPPNKSSSLVQIGSAGPTACSCAQNCHWNSNILSQGLFNSGVQRGSCVGCPTPPRPVEEPAQIWASALPLERSVRYQNSAPQHASLHLASSSHSLPQKVDFINRENDVKFSNHSSTSLDISEAFSRRNLEYQYVGSSSSSRHSGVEPQQNNVRSSLDLYSNETIPAMHLLSLMTAGSSFNTSGNPRFMERDFPPESNNRISKNYPPQMPIGVYNNNNKPREAAKYPLDYHSKSQLPVKSHNFFPVNPMPGPSTSSFRHEKSFERGYDFAGQVSLGSRGKEKVQRSSDSPSQSRGRKPLSPSFSTGRFPVPNHNSIPCHDARKGFLGPSSSVALLPSSYMAPPFQPRSSEYPTELKLGTPHCTETSRPLKPQPVTLTCSVNRNPADFSYPEAGNEYMINGEDLKVVRPRKRRALSIPGQSKRQRTTKRATGNEQA